MKTLALLLTVVSVLVSGCGSKWPVEYQLDSKLTQEQRETYMTAITMWNSVAAQRVGHDVLVPGTGVDSVTMSVGECQADPRLLGCAGEGLGATVNWDAVPADKRLANAAHEVGHTLGLLDLPCEDGSAIMCGALGRDARLDDVTEKDLAEFDAAKTR